MHWLSFEPAPEAPTSEHSPFTPCIMLFRSDCAILRNINKKIIAHYCALLFEVYRNRYAQLQKLSESGLAVLNCFKSSPEKRLKVSDIEKDTRLPRRTIQYALQTLTKKAFIQKLGQGAGTRYQLIF